MLIFSDGLQGESVTMLEQQSDRLREAGIELKMQTLEMERGNRFLPHMFQILGPV